MKMEASSSSSQDRKLPPTQQTLPEATANATFPGNDESPPLGSDPSLAPPSHATVSGEAESPPLDLPLVPPLKSQKMEASSCAGSSARKSQSMTMEASSLSSSSVPVKDSSQERELPPTQQTLPAATANATVSGTAESPPLDPEVVASSSDLRKPPRPDIISLLSSTDPLLGLRFTASPEFTGKIKSVPGLEYTEPSEAPKNLEKPKPIHLQISKITIGQWTRTSLQQEDLMAKFYFAKKKLLWEILDNVEKGTRVPRLMKRKIEINWADVLSLKPAFDPQEETGTLQVELSKRPTFFTETNPQARKQTQWKQTDQDFTLDQSASRCRRHTLHFSDGVLQNNWEKLVPSDSFWSELLKVNFPTLPQSPYFD